MTDLSDLPELLRSARHIVVFTGAGVSAESGISTFRDDLTALWSRFDAADLATPDAFRRDPDLVWGWYEWRRMKVLRASPNAGHEAIAAMERHVPKLTLITQNVDDLHERAGSSSVIHLHGSLLAPRCFACARPAGFPDELPDEPEGGRRVAPPKCSHCGGSVRPGVVWFGESLPQAALKAAFKAAESCQVLFSIGTSNLVTPAAEIPHAAAHAGAAVVQINPNSTPLDGLARFNLRGPSAQVLPRLIENTWQEN
jgi:NAD-dependent deacetylase